MSRLEDKYKMIVIFRWSILGPLCFLLRQHAQASDQHKETMLVFSQLQYGVLQTFLTAKKQREEKDQESEIEPGEVLLLLLLLLFDV
jgi:hypothetical protein